MRALGLRTRLFIAMGLPLGVGHLTLGSCSPTEPAESPPSPGPEDAAPTLPTSDAQSEASWSLSIETPSEAGSDASAVDASDASSSVTLLDAGSVDAAPPKRPRRSRNGWEASYKLAPGTEKWCKWGNTSCSAADDVANAVDDKKRFGCPRAIEVPCPCNGGGCSKGPDAVCVAPLYGPVTFRERAKVQNACCYDLPRQCIPPWVGRPLLVRSGEPLSLDSVLRSDWRGELDVSELVRAEPETRRERARVWERVASLEHASVASFARVSLQLLALGAPAELLTATHAAGMDEIEHARLAYAVASASGERDVGPAPLPLDALVIGPCTLADLAGETFRDGCVQETLGVLAARELLSQETSPTLCAVLERIVADEERHAELAWRTLAWALRSGGSTVLARLENELARALGETQPETTRAEVMRELIEPCARALLASRELSVSSAVI